MPITFSGDEDCGDEITSGPVEDDRWTDEEPCDGCGAQPGKPCRAGCPNTNE